MRKVWHVLLAVQLSAILNPNSPADGRCRHIVRYDCERSWQEFQGSCYLYVDVLRPYNDADSHCRAYSKQGRPAHLASIHSVEENQFIANLIGGTDAYIGFNDLASEGTYRWTDGTPVDYTNWKPDFPVGDAFGDQDCIHFWEGPEWKEFYCQGGLFSVCKIPKPTF